jgi:hypothetical protein
MALQTTSSIIERRNTKELYLTLFRHFTIYDQKDAHPNITKLLERLFSDIQNKSEFICEILQEFLLKPSQIYNKRNIIDFIQKTSPLSFNELLGNFVQIFRIEKPE